MSTGARIVVLGMAGRTPFAGVAWQVAHYVEGIRRLGHETWYIEDTGDWPYDPDRNQITDDWGYTARFLGALMERCGLEERWAYRSVVHGRPYVGPAAERAAKVIANADVLINLCGATVLAEEHMAVPVRVYLETDPVLPQIEVARGRQFTIDLLDRHTHHFTFGENIGHPDCGVPVERFEYRPTRQPIILDWWEPPGLGYEANGYPITTVASWRQFGKDVEWRGDVYLWSKHHEFDKVIDLPQRVSAPMELALACDDDADIARLREHGWRIVDALSLSRRLEPYRDYLLASRAEFTVAKDQNVRLASGWFSDRSACYLAAGKPVVTQETGFGNVVPTGLGLFPFRTIDEAGAAIEAIESDYAVHSRAAREIASECFSADRVLGRLLAEVGL